MRSHDPNRTTRPRRRARARTPGGRSRAAVGAAAREVAFRSSGERGLVVELGDAIDPVVNARVRWLARAIEHALGADVLEVVPTYRSVLVVHDPLRTPRARLVGRVAALVRRMPADAAEAAPSRVVRVPACYGGELGPDLEDVARAHGLAADEVVAIHAGATYVVYMLGFTPGFPYLGGLSARIATPRLPTPRPHVAAGSIGIAGAQTGIYPVASPGGWRIVARTPLRLFDPGAPAPFLFAPGDRVRFEPIGPEQFAEIARAIDAGTFTPDMSEGAP